MILPPPLLVEKEKKNNKNNYYIKEANKDLFIVGIKDDITEEDLKNTFLYYGDVLDCKIFRDKYTEKIKGSGIVKFKEKSGAYNAMNDVEEILCKGHPLRLRYSNRRNNIYDEREETKNKIEKHFCGRIRERINEREEGENII